MIYKKNNKIIYNKNINKKMIYNNNKIMICKVKYIFNNKIQKQV